MKKIIELIKSKLNIRSVVRSFTHDEVKNIILDYENIILYSQSHKLNRIELRKEFKNIRDKYKLWA